jgi:hypothetical protein
VRNGCPSKLSNPDVGAIPMNRIERFYKIDQMLHARGVVTLDTFLSELEVSRATFKRDMEYLRDRLHAPIVWDCSVRGYRLDGGHAIGPVYELPGPRRGQHAGDFAPAPGALPRQLVPGCLVPLGQRPAKFFG